MGCFSENSHRDRLPAQLLHTRRSDCVTSVWKVLSAGVLRSLVWMLQVMRMPGRRLILRIQTPLIVFYLRAWVGAAVMESIFRLWVVCDTL